MPISTNDKDLDSTNKKLEVDNKEIFFFSFSKKFFKIFIYRQLFVIQQFKWVVGQLQMIIY
jgi:hypothetical protein